MSLNCQSFVNQFAKLPPPQSHTLAASYKIYIKPLITESLVVHLPQRLLTPIIWANFPNLLNGD